MARVSAPLRSLSRAAESLPTRIVRAFFFLPLKGQIPIQAMDSSAPGKYVESRGPALRRIHPHGSTYACGLRDSSRTRADGD